MPRKARIDYPGLTHHVMARTFQDAYLFYDNEDRAFYLSCLSNRILECGFRCFAWAFMDNHVHLCVKTSERPLWHLMKPLNSDYVQYFNKKYKRRGVLFPERFKSIATQDQLYLERLVRYIHRNPLRSGQCKTITELDRYPWTGHSALMGFIPNHFQDTWAVLKRFGKNVTSARKNYRHFITENLGEVDDTIITLIRENNAGTRNRNRPECWVIGDPEFQKMILKKDRDKRCTITRFKKEGWSLDHLLEIVSKKMNIPPGLLLQTSKRTTHAKARKIFCHLARELGFSTRDIGNYLGIQQAAVSNGARKGIILAQKYQIKL